MNIESKYKNKIHKENSFKRRLKNGHVVLYQHVKLKKQNTLITQKTFNVFCNIYVNNICDRSISYILYGMLLNAKP